MFACVYRVIVVASVSDPKELSSGALVAFVHQVVIERPAEEQRRAVLGLLSEGLPLGRNVNLSRLARQTVVRQSLLLEGLLLLTDFLKCSYYFFLLELLQQLLILHCSDGVECII